MGQGYSLTTLPAGSAGIDVPEMADLTYEKALGNARFMKSIRAKHRDGPVTAKVVMKPYSALKFDKFIRAIIGTCVSLHILYRPSPSDIA
jgi:phosphoinositide-3-kinase regulatory subunit 4